MFRNQKKTERLINLKNLKNFSDYFAFGFSALIVVIVRLGVLPREPHEVGPAHGQLYDLSHLLHRPPGHK